MTSCQYHFCQHVPSKSNHINLDMILFNHTSVFKSNYLDIRESNKYQSQGTDNQDRDKNRKKEREIHKAFNLDTLTLTFNLKYFYYLFLQMSSGYKDFSTLFQYLFVSLKKRYMVTSKVYCCLKQRHSILLCVLKKQTIVTDLI